MGDRCGRLKFNKKESVEGFERQVSWFSNRSKTLASESHRGPKARHEKKRNYLISTEPQEANLRQKQETLSDTFGKIQKNMPSKIRIACTGSLKVRFVEFATGSSETCQKAFFHFSQTFQLNGEVRCSQYS